MSKRAVLVPTLWLVVLFAAIVSCYLLAENGSGQSAGKSPSGSHVPAALGANGLPPIPQATIPPGARLLPNASQLFPTAPPRPKAGQSVSLFRPKLPTVSTDPLFLTPPVYPSVGTDSVSVAAGDLNGDGAVDLVVADNCQSSGCSNNSGDFSVFLNNGDGTYKAPVSYASGGLYAWSVAVGDVNGDGHADIVVANHCADSNCNNSSVSVLLGNGDGTFQSPTTYLTDGTWQPQVVLSDFNRDGKLDIAVSNFEQANHVDGGMVSIFLNNGDGTFQPAVGYSAGTFNSYDVAVGDFNGDGAPDLILVNQCASPCTNAAVSVLLNSGNGTFGSASVISVPGYYGLSGVVGDFNGDGKADIAVLSQCVSNSDCSSSMVTVLPGNGDGTFQSPLATALFSVNFTPGQSLALGDVNGDGKPDLAVVSDSSDEPLQLLLGNGDGTFQPPAVFGLLNNGRALVFTDLNGDGKLDIAALELCNSNCGSSPGAVVLFFGNGGGTFQAPSTYQTAGQFAVGGTIADVNGDGKPDLIVTNQCASNTNCANGTVSVLLGNGDGTLQPGTAYPVGRDPWGVVVGDVNGDGKPDLIVANECVSDTNCTNGSVTVLLGNGDGTFQAGQSYASTGQDSLNVALGDFNGDGKIDIVLTNECSTSSTCGSGGSVSIFLGNGDGTFQTAQSVATGGSYAFDVAVGDVNGDGNLDLLVADYCASGTCQNGAFAVLLGNGDGTFQAPVVYTSTAVENRTIVVGDFNGDGKLDVATGDSCAANGNCNNSAISVFLGNGDGTFQSGVDYPIGNGLFGFESLVMADFNGDGAPDLAALTYYSGANVLLGNGDGTFQPPLTFSGGNYGLAVGDLNLDGKPDLVALLNTSPGFATVLLNTATGFRYATTTTISSSMNPATAGQSVTFTATVFPGFKGTPTGNVTFYDGGTAIGTGALSATKTNSGGYQATFSISSLAAGSHSITAGYAGDSNFLASTSAAVTQFINTPTTTTLTSSPNPSSFGQGVTFTATVSWSGGGTPTGTMTFADEGSTLATVPLSGNQAMMVTSALATGGHSITATYSGDSNFVGSTSSPLAQTVNQAGARVTLASNINPSVYNQTVTLTATITTQFGGQATGNVVFVNQVTGESCISTVSGNVASCAAGGSLLPAGNDTVVATYQGDSNFAGSSSAPFHQTVNQATTTGVVTSSLNPALVNQPITFVASVNGQYGGSPTGSVTFKAGTTTLGARTLSGGQTSLTTSFSSGGKHAVTAVYAGDVNYIGSTSAASVETVNKFPTTATLGSSVDPSLVGQSVTFTAKISSGYGAIADGDKVVFKDGSAVLAIVTTTGGTATYSPSGLGAGSHNISASYLGDASFAPCAASFKQTVNKNPSSTTVTSSLNPSSYGQAVTFSATVSGGAGTPSGTVAFKNGAITLASSTLSGGTSSVTTSSLGAGTNSIVAVYGGDSTYLGNTSPVLTQKINKATTTTTVTSSPNPSVTGQTVTFTVMVAPQNTGTPAGTVTLKSAATKLATLSLVNGSASYTTSTLPQGSDVITATYSGSSNFTTSSGTLTQIVTAAPSTTNSSISEPTGTVPADGSTAAAIGLTLKDASNKPISGLPVTFTATNGVFDHPSGTTNSSGFFSANLTSTKAGTSMVTATAGGISLNGRVTFVAGNPSAATSSFVANPTSVPPDGISTSQLTLILNDANGNRVTGQAITLSSTGSGNTITPASGTTDTSGTFKATIASTVAETKTVTASAGTFIVSVNVQFGSLCKNVICVAIDQCHVAGTCNPATGVCSNPNAADGTVCNDGNACTETDFCQAGACTGTNPVVCVAEDQCHAAGLCDPSTGVCSNPQVPNGTACNNGSGSGICTNGVCQ